MVGVSGVGSREIVPSAVDRGTFSIRPGALVSLQPIKGHSRHLTTNLLGSWGRKGKFLYRVPTCTTM